MLLAGGQGSRLGFLTTKMAKPAVPFGGKYRIIDFPLSNCSHSGIDTVGVLTQYQPLELNSYIGSGQPWALDVNSGGVFVLPPYQGKHNEWYKGTANAIYQNIAFIEQFDPEYVLILSGDHIYKMEYDKMIDYHKRTKADVTIAVFDVPIEEASRFGIMTTDDEGRIVKFTEKPTRPDSTKASMGVYVFDWKLLRQHLKDDEADTTSVKDFGKNIIPKMLNEGLRLMAYEFSGYWKDVGTVESLWEANMDLLKDPPVFNLYDDSWRIYSRSSIKPPHYVAAGAVIENSLVTEGCDISGTIRHSVLFAGVTVEKGAVIEDSVIMPGATVCSGAKVIHSIVAENAVISKNCVVGGIAAPGAEKKTALVGQNALLPQGYKVEPGEQVSAETLTIDRGNEV